LPDRNYDVDDILREIRQVNDEIPDEVMSAKIDRIEEITGKILRYQKEHPNKEGQLRTFLNYYLPTTLKLLNAYDRMDATGASGTNIDGTKGKIGEMLGTICVAFSRQLDALYGEEALDISADIQVMETLLAREGLTEPEMKADPVQEDGADIRLEL